MSRIGKKPVTLPKGVTATVDGQQVSVKGPKGELAFLAADDIEVKMEDGHISVMPRDQSKKARVGLGHVAHDGVEPDRGRDQGLRSAGWRSTASAIARRCRARTCSSIWATATRSSIRSRPDIKIECPKPTEIVISGIDKQKVGQVAAEIREFRPPEPYKGKGVKYADEHIFRKEGKKK